MTPLGVGGVWRCFVPVTEASARPRLRVCLRPEVSGAPAQPAAQQARPQLELTWRMSSLCCFQEPLSRAPRLSSPGGLLVPSTALEWGAGSYPDPRRFPTGCCSQRSAPKPEQAPGDCRMSWLHRALPCPHGRRLGSGAFAYLPGGLLFEEGLGEGSGACALPGSPKRWAGQRREKMSYRREKR